MAAGVLPTPSPNAKTLGPCAPDCHTWTAKHRPERVIPEGESHTDCASIREMAESTCRLCGNTIGFDVRFYEDPDEAAQKKLVHAACLETQP